MCEKHPGREVEVCGEVLCAGCSEEEFMRAKLPKFVRREPFVEPVGEHDVPVLVPGTVEYEAFRALILASPVKEYTAEERAKFKAIMAKGRS